MTTLNAGVQPCFTGTDLQRITAVSIGIAGVGGIGSNCAALLVRCGFQNFTLVDFDEITDSNLNRQYYTLAQVGREKVKALAENLRLINPKLHLTLNSCKITSNNVRNLFQHCDIVVEGFDEVGAKTMLIEALGNTDKLVVAISGIAGYGDADRIKTRRVRDNLYIIGHGDADVKDVAPFAPAVTIAAAKQADVILAYVLRKKAIK